MNAGTRFVFGHVHLIVGGGVQDQRRVGSYQRLFDLSRVADVHAGAVETGDGVTALGQLAHQLHAELAPAAEDDHVSPVH